MNGYKMKQFKAIIDDVIVQADKIQPIIVNFQNGELKDEEVKEMSCGLFRDQKEDKTVLALSNGHIVYKGYRPDTKKDSTRTMLVFHNKKTGKIRLLEAERWEVTPVLEKPLIEDNKSDASEKIVTLKKQFGSKKDRRRTEQYEKLKMNIDNVKEQLEKTATNIEIDRLDLSTQSQTDDIENMLSSMCNRDATNVKDAYNIYKIIPKSKLETLYEYAMEVFNESTEGKSEFFKYILQIIQSDPDKVNKVSLLLYIEMISTWFGMPMKEAKKCVICPFSAEVNQHIIDTYSENGRLRPINLKDKGLVHILVVALIVSNFELDLKLFRDMLEKMRTSLKKLKDLAKIIGAAVDKDIITLKMPLRPTESLARKRRRKPMKS